MFHHYCGYEPLVYHSGHEGACHPYGGAVHHDCMKFVVFREEVVTPDDEMKEFFIGGSHNAKPVVEYMRLSGVKTPAITVSVTSPEGGEPRIWTPDTFPENYAVHELEVLHKGTRVQVKLSGCIARCRWFETVYYHHQ